MGKAANAKLHAVGDDAGENEEQPRSAAEIAEDLRKVLTIKDFDKMCDDLDRVEAKIAQAQDERNEIYQRLVKKGANKTGLKNYYKRRGKPPQQQAAIDATFKVACELSGDEDDLFGYD